MQVQVMAVQQVQVVQAAEVQVVVQLGQVPVDVLPLVAQLVDYLVLELGASEDRGRGHVGLSYCLILVRIVVLRKVHYFFISFFVSWLNSLIKFIEKLHLAVSGLGPIVSITVFELDTVLVFGGRNRLVDIAQRVWSVQALFLADQLIDRSHVIHQLVLLSSVSKTALSPAVTNGGVRSIRDRLGVLTLAMH